ncbi:MAG: hypothetical protein JW993_12630 [Sedimentisphaerales bacterium]|nr:hypothetical protein [Sedimentisphaerales bacterium]
MRTRVVRRAVLIGLTILMLTGCGRQIAQLPGDDLLAIGPDQTALAAVRPDYILAAVEAAGGLPTWLQCRRIDLSGVVAAYRPDNSYYLTEHTFTAFPWSEALRITAHEPQAEFTWLMVVDRFELLKGDANLDVSPLAGAYQNYASAVLQVVTAPARLLDRRTQLSRQPFTVQIRGRAYDPIDARFRISSSAGAGTDETSRAAALYWTNGTYYLNRENSLAEMVWLANPLRQDFLIVWGYDYAPVSADGVRVPTKIEIFRSDAEARIGPRLAKIDLVM